MIEKKNILSSFSKHLFWDVDKSTVDIHKNKKHIINTVIQYGFYKDWKIIVKLYSIKQIATIAIKNRSLDKKTAAFIALVSNTPTSIFLCYTTKQSTPKHWNF